MTDYRAELQRLVKAYDEHGGKWPDEDVRALHNAVKTARTALAQPETEKSRPAPNYNRVPEIATEAEIRAAAQYLIKKKHCDGDLIPAIEYAVARWGRPTIKPVPVSERLPGPEDCDEEGRCWWWCHHYESWQLDHAAHYRHWLPYHALPLPTP